MGERVRAPAPARGRARAASRPIASSSSTAIPAVRARLRASARTVRRRGLVGVARRAPASAVAPGITWCRTTGRRTCFSTGCAGARPDGARRPRERRVAASRHALRGHDRRRGPCAVLRDLAVPPDVHRARALPAHARAARSWSLAADLADARRERDFDGHVVFRCLHLVYGVGTIPVREILEARDRLVAGLREGRRRYLVSTVQPLPRPGDPARRRADMTSEVIAFAAPRSDLHCGGRKRMQRRALFGTLASGLAGTALARRTRAKPRRRTRPALAAPGGRHFLDVGRRDEPLLQGLGERPAARLRLRLGSQLGRLGVRDDVPRRSGLALRRL